MTLHNVTVVDPKLGLSHMIATLGVGRTATYNLSYGPVTESDLPGPIVNTATADSDETPSVSDSHSVAITTNPAIAITKLANKTSVATAGESITYTFTVTNPGNVTLSGITLTDTKTDAAPTYVGGDTNANSKLEVSETWTYTGVHTVTQAELDLGAAIVNVATVDSVESVPATDTETVYVTQGPAIAITKLANKTSVATAGESITYTFTVTNPGNVTLSGITLTDTKTDAAPTYVGGDTNANSKLEVSETWTYTGVHTVTQAELDLGAAIVNVATVDSVESVPATDTETVYVTQGPAIAITKLANKTSVATAGESITYTFTVTNPGNVTLSGITLTDTKTDAAPTYVGGDTNANSKLEVSETWTYTGVHTVTQAELDLGAAIVNVATVDSVESVPATDTETVYVTQGPAIAITKLANKTSVATAGESITYTFTVTNPGNVTLSGITLTDTKTDAAPTYVGGDTNANSKLEVSETWTYTGVHTVTQAELDLGAAIVNVATVDSVESVPATDTETVYVTQGPAIAITKLANKTSVATAGESITYTFTVTNPGNVTLSGITLTDTKTDAAPTYVGGDTNANSKLEVSETWTYTGVHTVTQAELDLGAAIVNVATVDSVESVPATDTETVYVTQGPAIAITKLANKTSVATAGESITYTFTVTNPGNVTLSGITLTDTKTDAAPTYVGGDTNANSKLEVSETWTYTGVHTVTQAELDLGAAIVNVATVDSVESVPATDTETVYVTQGPAIAIVKTGDVGPVSIGGTVHYTIAVSNVGNVTLHNVTTLDPKLGLSHTLATLGVGLTATYNLTYGPVSETDWPSIINTATAESGRDRVSV